MHSVFLRHLAVTKSNCLSKDRFLVSVSGTTRSAVNSRAAWLNLFSVGQTIRARKSRITVSQARELMKVKTNIICLVSESCLTQMERVTLTIRILMLRSLSLLDLNATLLTFPLMYQRV